MNSSVAAAEAVKVASIGHYISGHHVAGKSRAQDVFNPATGAVTAAWPWRTVSSSMLPWLQRKRLSLPGQTPHRCAAHA